MNSMKVRCDGVFTRFTDDGPLGADAILHPPGEEFHETAHSVLWIPDELHLERGQWYRLSFEPCDPPDDLEEVGAEGDPDLGDHELEGADDGSGGGDGAADGGGDSPGAPGAAPVDGEAEEGS